MKPDYERYYRQTSLDTFGAVGQAKLAVGRVLIVGLGGLGIPAAQYLNSMGVGTLGLMDNDIIELNNLQRQVLYGDQDVGRAKLEVALEKLQRQNSETVLVPISDYLSRENALHIIENYDVVVDASDNFATRYLVNDACVILKKPFVYGALHAFEGQVSVFNHLDGPTYRCLFPNMPGVGEVPNCNENGVLGVIPGIIGSLQALETVKILTGVGEPLSGQLLIYDGLTQTTRKIAFKPNPTNKAIEKLSNDYGTLPCKLKMSVSAEAYLQLSTPHQLIDVRTAMEFEGDHLRNARNIPLDDLELHHESIDFTTPVYLICQSGKRSEVAFQLLSRMEPNAAITHIEGGMNRIASLCH